MPLKVLICGGGCAGPALAYWLARTGHNVTVCERFDALRASGAQIDLRAQGIEVAKRMGDDIHNAIRQHLVDEAGVAIINSQGKIKGTIMVNRSGKGAQGPTSEYEIMRGDLVRILYDATTILGVRYIFGKTVDCFEQDEESVTAYFSDGLSDTFDILVGADGQGSRIRKAMLPPDEPEPYRRIGVHMAYWFIPRDETDSNIRRTYICSGGRLIWRRTHNDSETQVYFVLRDDDPALSSIPKGSVESQKEFWTQRFRDAGWQTDRFLEGIKTTKNFYCQEVVQVQTHTWSKGRLVLLGDAAHCPSPFSGMGTTTSLFGAYVLAGELNRNEGDVSKAFSNYDKTLRPFIEEAQKIKTGLLRYAMPKTWWGVAIVQFVVMVICFLRVPALIQRFSKEEKGGWRLPDYPELKYDVRPNRR